MKILADVDGVMLNWEDPFHAWMKRKGHSLAHKESYDIWRCYPELSPDEITELIKTFNSSATMGFLPPIGDAVYWVRRMHEMHGATFHCITSMGDDLHARWLRVMNLERIFGERLIHDVTILSCGADKTLALSEYENSGLVWLEDNVKNATVGACLGLNTFLFNRTYNNTIEAVEPFTRVNDWAELYNHLFAK